MTPNERLFERDAKYRNMAHWNNNSGRIVRRGLSVFSLLARKVANRSMNVEIVGGGAQYGLAVSGVTEHVVTGRAQQGADIPRVVVVIDKETVGLRVSGFARRLVAYCAKAVLGREHTVKIVDVDPVMGSQLPGFVLLFEGFSLGSFEHGDHIQRVGFWGKTVSTARMLVASANVMSAFLPVKKFAAVLAGTKNPSRRSPDWCRARWGEFSSLLEVAPVVVDVQNARFAAIPVSRARVGVLRHVGKRLHGLALRTDALSFRNGRGIGAVIGKVQLQVSDFYLSVAKRAGNYVVGTARSFQVSIASMTPNVALLVRVGKAFLFGDRLTNKPLFSL